jgi:SPW repeat
MEYPVRFMSTRMHGMADYLVGIILILAPYLLGFADGTAAQYVPQIVGVGTIIYSLLTDYELGAMRVIPMPVHLGLDFASGLLLLASPWLFGFADRITWPHVLFGLIEIGASLTTRTRPSVSHHAGGTASGTLS